MDASDGLGSVGPIVLVRNLADDLIGFARDTLGLRDWRVLGQTDVHVSDVEVVSWKELAMKVGDEECPRRQAQGRGGKNPPTMVDGESDRALVSPAEPAFALLDRRDDPVQASERRTPGAEETTSTSRGRPPSEQAMVIGRL